MNTITGSIVVGVDGSPSAQRALDWALTVAAREHRAITLVHAVGAISPAAFDPAAVDPGTVRERVEQQGRDVLLEAQREVAQRAPGLEVHTVFSLDDPREVLLDLTADAAMVVVGSRGLGRVRRLLLGSVGVALVRHAVCPVVVHRPGNPGLVRNGILVGADGSPQSRAVLEFAYRQASIHDLPLIVVHTFWDVQAASLETVVAVDASDAEEQRLLLAESMAGLAEKYPEVRATIEVLRGRPEQAVVSLADRMNLVVLGHHHGSRAAQLIFGSVAVAVVEHATCPVAVVPVAYR